jgi:carboxylesterase type B
MTVIIEQGTLQGIHYKTQASNKPYVSFLGIPYAKPPVGDLRFKVRRFLVIYIIQFKAIK